MSIEQITEEKLKEIVDKLKQIRRAYTILILLTTIAFFIVIYLLAFKL